MSRSRNRGRVQAPNNRNKQQRPQKTAVRAKAKANTHTDFADTIPSRNGHTTPVSREMRFPWIIGVASVITLGSIVPNTWAFAWTRDPSSVWAQPTFLLVGLVALIPFLHALTAAQGLASTKGCTEEDRELPRAVSEKALSRVAAGILSGTLYALYVFSDGPPGIKATSLVADLATIGGVLGLLTCIRYNIKMMKSSLIRLQGINRRNWRNILSAIVVIDLLLSWKLAYLLPSVIHMF